MFTLSLFAIKPHRHDGVKRCNSKYQLLPTIDFYPLGTISYGISQCKQVKERTQFNIYRQNLKQI